MPIRIYDIAQELGLDSHTVLAKAKELGITGAKVPSSSLDKITGEYLREKIRESLPVTRDAANPVALALVLPAGSGPLPMAAAPALKARPSITIRPGAAEFCIRVNGPEEYAKALAGELEFCLEVAETENSPPLRLRLTRDNAPRLVPGRAPSEPQPRTEIDGNTVKLFRAAYCILSRNSTDDWVNLADYGNALKKLEPTFQAQDFGERSLGALVRRLSDVFEMRADEHNPIVYYVREKTRSQPSIPRAVGPEPGIESKPEATIFPLALPKLAHGKIHNVKLGFGFIKPDDGSENLFFHATEVVGCTIFDLHPGDPVEYEPDANEKGLCARKVRRVG